MIQPVLLGQNPNPGVWNQGIFANRQRRIGLIVQSVSWESLLFCDIPKMNERKFLASLLLRVRPRPRGSEPLEAYRSSRHHLREISRVCFVWIAESAILEV
jgi:hypothetical protein